MENGILQLDGFVNSVLLLEEHYGEVEDKKPFLRREIWSRLVSPLQIALCLIHAVATQLTRGITLVFAGIISLDRRLCWHGARDLISVPVQIVAMPIFAFLSFFAPHHVKTWMCSIVDKFTGDFGCAAYMFDRNAVRGRIIAVVSAIISIPLCIIRNSLRLLERSFSLCPLEAVTCIALIVKEPFVNLAIAFGSIGPESIRARAFYSFLSIYGYSPRQEFYCCSRDHIHSITSNVVQDISSIEILSA